MTTSIHKYYGECTYLIRQSDYRDVSYRGFTLQYIRMCVLYICMCVLYIRMYVCTVNMYVCTVHTYICVYCTHVCMYCTYICVYCTYVCTVYVCVYCTAHTYTLYKHWQVSRRVIRNYIRTNYSVHEHIRMYLLLQFCNMQYL